MFSNQFAGVVKTVCAAANMKLAMWVATRLKGYSWGERSEVGSRTTEDGRQETVLKNVESLKALQSYNQKGRASGSAGRADPGGRSNQRITANRETLQYYLEFIAHKIFLFLVNGRVCHEFHIA